MGKLDVQSTVTLVLNGEQAKTSLRDITRAVNSVRAEVSRMNEADNPELYRRRVAELNRLTEAQRERRAEIAGTTRALQQQTEAVKKDGEAQKNFFSDFKKGFSEISEMAGSITAGTLIYKGVSAIIGGVKSLFDGAAEAYDESVRTQTQLQQALQSTGGVVGLTKKQLEAYQQTLMNQTGIDDDVIAKGEEMLLTFTNIRGKIYEDALPAIIDMSAAMNGGVVSMESIQATAIQVGKALNDPINGMTSLKKVGVTFSDQQKEQIKTMQDSNNMMGAQALILQELSKEFGGTAEAIANTDVGALQKFNTRIDNIKESIGKWMAEGKNLLATALNPLVGKIEELTSTKYSETLEDERFEMNKLGIQITDTNLTHDERIKLIEKLKGMYPEHLKNLNAEKTTNEGIAKVVANLNELYINRIILAQKDEEIEKQNQQSAELKMKQLKAEDELRGQLVKLKAKFPEFTAPDGTTVDKVRAYVQYYKELKANSGMAGGGIFDPTFSAGKALRDYYALNEFTNTSINRGNLLLQKRNELIKELGIDTTFEGVTEDNPGVTPPVSGPPKSEQDAAKKKIAEFIAQSKALTDKYNDFNQAEIISLLAKNDKEVADAEHKYEQLIKLEQDFLDKNKGNKFANAAELQHHEDEIGKLEVAKRDQVNKIRARQEEQLAERITSFRDKMATRHQTELEKETLAINQEFDKQLEEAGNNQRLQHEIEAGRQAAMTDAKLREEERFQAEKEKIQDEGLLLTGDKDAIELARINKKYDDEIEALKNKFDKERQATQEFQDLIDGINANRTAETEKKDQDKKKDEKKKLREAAIDAADDIAKAVFSIGARNRQAETDKQLKDLDRRKEAELSNKNLTEAQKDAINQKYAKQEAAIKKKAWEAQKAADLQAAVINGALAVTKTFATLGWPAGIIPAAAAAVATGVQIATINSQKTPEFAKGGTLIPKGPSHAEGGINLVNNRTGEVIGEMEGDEPITIFSKDTYRNNRMLINELLYNSQYRNGAPVSINTGYATRPAGSMYQNGGIVPGRTSPQTSGNTRVGDSSRLAELEDKLLALTDLVAAEASKPVTINYHYFMQEQAKNVAIENAAKG